MANFSPLAQRVIAAMLALLALLFSVQLMIVPLFDAVVAERQAFADASFRLARMEAVVEGPPPPRPEAALIAQLVVAPDAQNATAELAAQLMAGARLRGLIVRTAPVAIPSSAAGRAILVNVEVSGSADMMLAWIADVENGSPLVRFDQLTLEAAGTGPARMSGTARAVWMRGR